MVLLNKSEKTNIGITVREKSIEVNEIVEIIEMLERMIKVKKERLR